MTYNGHIENGAIVLSEPSTLTEGAAIRVVVLPQAEAASPVEPPVIPSIYEQCKEFVGIVDREGLPSDLALNHNHYLHGRPKQ